MEWVDKISKIIAYIIVIIVKIIVYPVFYVTKTLRIFFLLIESGSYNVLESLSFEERKKDINNSEDDDVSFVAGDYTNPKKQEYKISQEDISEVKYTQDSYYSNISSTV
jgi:hypothetical protein